jgi:limonene-1,2-epoxide hydrolase
VFTERIDHHSHGNGRGLTTPHIAGVMEVRDGRMSARRDVYDTVIFSPERTQSGPAVAAGRAQ